ncbi:MAG: 6-phosphofructokinase [Treponemataceae bacterium]
MSKSVSKTIGILTSGGDAPGLNAAIRGVARTAIDQFDMKVIGIRDGYRGLIENNTFEMHQEDFSGIIMRGGTILGTSREKPFKTANNENGINAVDHIKQNYKKLGLDALVVLGGNGTNTTGSLLHNEGLNIIGLPKTIDNDIAETDTTFGFHSAVSVATEAIDRIHTTAHSHNRIMVVEVMGHKAGWLGLYAGVAGGGDIILLPEIPYNIDSITKHLVRRKQQGKAFSIVVVAEGARSIEEAMLEKKVFKKQRSEMTTSIGYRVAKELSIATQLEPRVTVLGYVQRGGTPVPYDRVLATQFGTHAVHLLAKGEYGKMVALKNNEITSVPLEKIAGKTKKVPMTDSLLISAREVGTCFGDN